jgi:diguanylate cyclase (GGDEF)-like protein
MIDVHRPESREPSEAEIELFRLASRFASVSIEQSELNSELAYRAQHDPLTGLLNRASFEQRMVRTVAHASRYGRRVGFLSLDLDRFKIINDMLGHAAGDELITQLARRLSSCFRETDFVARWGGDEFVVGLTEIGEPQDAHKAAAKLLDTLKAPFQLGGREITTTASIGVSVFPDDGPDLETLIRRADTAMYRAKRNGRNGFHCYNAGIGEMDRRRLEMEAHLRIALERGEFSLSYQPQVDLRTGALGGLEALLRWHNTELGPIPPSTFIPIAEESGFIIQIGDWVVRQACKQIKEFERSGCGPIRVAVNVSGIQFSRGDFVDVVAQAIEDAKIESRFLELELTESFLMEPCNGADTRMESLRALGVKISIDDFGTGFSSLSSLHQLPIDCLKIDQSFVRGLGESPRAPVFVGSILALAKSLGIVTIAEGVESKEQLDVLRESGCDLVQGYLLGVPLSPSQIISRLVWPEARSTWCSILASPEHVRRQRPRRDVAGVNGRKQYAGVA